MDHPRHTSLDRNRPRARYHPPRRFDRRGTNLSEFPAPARGQQTLAFLSAARPPPGDRPAPESNRGEEAGDNNKKKERHRREGGTERSE